MREWGRQVALSNYLTRLLVVTQSHISEVQQAAPSHVLNRSNRHREWHTHHSFLATAANIANPLSPFQLHPYHRSFPLTVNG